MLHLRMFLVPVSLFHSGVQLAIMILAMMMCNFAAKKIKIYEIHTDHTSSFKEVQLRIAVE